MTSGGKFLQNPLNGFHKRILCGRGFPGCGLSKKNLLHVKISVKGGGLGFRHGSICWGIKEYHPGSGSYRKSWMPVPMPVPSAEGRENVPTGSGVRHAEGPVRSRFLCPPFDVPFAKEEGRPNPGRI
jgi:hypothetical protein